MQLNVKGNGPYINNLKIIVNNEEKMFSYIGDESYNLSFDIPESGSYEITVHDEEENIFTRNSIIVFIFTFPFQALYYGFLDAADKLFWWTDIRPYGIKTKFKIDIDRDTNISLDYIQSQYNGRTKEWNMPEIKIQPPVYLEEEILINKWSFRNELYRFCKGLLSTSLVALTLFLTILILSIINNKRAEVLIVFSVLVGLIILVNCILIPIAYRKMKKLKSQFIDK